MDAARRLFSEKPVSQVSTGDVAEAAGVARTLVHHYFGGIRPLYLAVIGQSAASLANVRTEVPPTPIDERLAHNVPASLDVVGENRETWFAVMGHRHSSGDPQVDKLLLNSAEFMVQRSLTVHNDVISNTPSAQAALRAIQEFSAEITRRWLDGEITRSQCEALLISTWRHVLLEAIPAAEQAAD